MTNYIEEKKKEILEKLEKNITKADYSILNDSFEEFNSLKKTLQLYACFN